MKRNINHVAFFVPSLNIGGVESVFLTYADMLVNHGFTVDFVVCKAKGTLLNQLSDKVNLINLGNISFRVALRPLRNYIEACNVGTLITGPDFANILAIIATRFLREPINLIVSQHCVFDNDAKDFGLLGYMLPLLKRIFYRFATNILSVSDGVQRELIKLGIPYNKIITIYNPIDYHNIILKSEKSASISLPSKYIVFIGRLSNVKNIPLLIKALQYIDNEVELLIVGDGEQRESLEQMSAKTTYSPRIHFLGSMSNPFPLMRNALVVALPSYSEAFPMVVVEAMALGKTVVYTPNMGAIELLDYRYGYCCNSFNDPQKFADALKKGIDCPIDSSVLKQKAMQLDVSIIYSKIETLVRGK